MQIFIRIKFFFTEPGSFQDSISANKSTYETRGGSACNSPDFKQSN